MHLLSAILVIASVGANAAAVIDDGVETHRVLRAATKKVDLYRRGVRITKRFETEMAYVDKENVWTDASTFASQVKVGSQKPVFNIEEHEHHLQGVECSEDAMKLHFVDASSARDARAACYGNNGGLIITSHSGCNEEGERSVYRSRSDDPSVNDVSFAEDGETLEVSVAKTTWQEAFDHVNVTFGHTTDDHIYRRHADFASIRRKRHSRIEIPADTPDDVNTAVFNLAAAITDTTFAAVDFLDIIGDFVPIPELPVNVPIEVGCANCATRGQLALSHGAFNIDASQIDLIPDTFQGGDDGKEISSVITGGYMELVATGVGARLELFARPRLTGAGAFEVALFSVPIVGFTIPGIGKAGAVFEPRVRFEFEVDGELEIHYGLDVNVPDGSSLRVELTDLSSSSLTGFQDTSFTPLPVTVDKADLELLLGLAFKPTIPIGFEFFDQLKAEVTASLDLPRLDAKLTTDTPENCGDASDVTAPGTPFSNTTTDLSNGPITLGPLALVEANVSISCDVGFDLRLPLLPPPFNSVSAWQNVFEAVFPLITECTPSDSAFNDSLGVVIPPPPSSATTSVMPTMNATAVPAFNTTSSGTPVIETTATPTINATSSTLEAYIAMTLGFNTTSSVTLVADAAATPASETGSMNVTSTRDGYVMFSTAMLSTPASMTSEIVSATSVSNTTAILASDNISATSTCEDTAIPTTEALASTSPLNSTSVLASSTALASSTLNAITTTASSTVLTSSILIVDTTSASNTPLATSSLNTISTAMLNYTMSVASVAEPTETSCESSSTTTLTDISYVTFRITRETTVTPPASVKSLDPTVVFTLFSTSSEEAAIETSAMETPSASKSLGQEYSSSVEETTSSLEISATSTPENTSASASSAAESSATPSSSIASASSIVSSAPAISTTPAAPAPAPPAPAESLPPPAAVVTMSVGFLAPSNASALPVQESGITEFTGAAARDIQVPGQKALLGLVMGFVGVWFVGEVF
ncbi:gpi anchored protein [Stemphylium lycopersici]|uniref:Gpi anchored protein n=1 Tax=Stemphylium lycopersici TaxID=183478 RepID=A0A364NC29_STELY|nr:gpi anchored protein [Stemphylium lycopersici]RAR14611.1 gpi anchored protein [Stemphylium lycopersici]